MVYANQKLFRKNLWGRLEPPPPLVSEGLIYDLSDHGHILNKRGTGRVKPQAQWTISPQGLLGVNGHLREGDKSNRGSISEQNFQT